MYRALLDYTPPSRSDALRVRAGDKFMFIQQHDANWWKMETENGHVGLVPASYLTPDEQEMVCFTFIII